MKDKVLRPLFKLFSPNYLWKKECPNTPAAGVADFIANQVSQESKNVLASFSEKELEDGKTLVFRRRIAAIYGIADNYDSPDGSLAKAGWNKKLIKNCGFSTLEKAVSQLLHMVWEKVRQDS